MPRNDLDCHSPAASRRTDTFGARAMKRLEAINDFVVKFANVNGSGSASANELFAKAILRDRKSVV